MKTEQIESTIERESNVLANIITRRWRDDTRPWHQVAAYCHGAAMHTIGDLHEEYSFLRDCAYFRGFDAIYNDLKRAR